MQRAFRGMVALLLFTNLTLTTTQQFDTINGCIPPTTNIVFKKSLNCPCYLGYSLHSPIDTSTTTDFIFLQTSEYEVWERNNFTGIPVTIPQHTIFNASTTSSLFKAPIETGSGSYTFLIRTHSKNEDCSIRVLHLFIPMRVCNDQRGNRIVGGVPARALTRHMVILESSQGYCSGTLLSPKHVLTAAHCNVNSGIARIGSPSGAIYNIKSFHKHPLYKPSPTLPRFDIGVITLSHSVNNTHGQGLRFARSGTIKDVLVTGFGQTHERIPSTAFRELRSVTVSSITLPECRTMFSEAGFRDIGNDVQEGMLCLGGECGDSCYGDSGGAGLVMRNGSYVVVGVISAGIGCGRIGLPGVYTDVRAFAEWVEGIVGVGGVDVDVVEVEREGKQVFWIGVGVVGALVVGVVGVVLVDWGFRKIRMREMEIRT